MKNTYLPSVKALAEIADDRAPELRALLELDERDVLEGWLERMEDGKYLFPVTRAWYFSCYHPMPVNLAKLSIASEITGGHGVEAVLHGRTKRSPGFEYVNAGDPDAATLILMDNGQWRVGCYGDIVERGRYA